MKHINIYHPPVKRPALDQSRFQITKLTDLISLYTQWNNYTQSQSLNPAEQAEINRLAHILRQFLPSWEEKLLEKHVAILEKNDWWGIGREFSEILPHSLQTLHHEWTAYQKLADEQIKPEIVAKIKFVRKVYLRQRVVANLSSHAHSPPDFPHYRSRESVEKPPTTR